MEKATFQRSAHLKPVHVTFREAKPERLIRVKHRHGVAPVNVMGEVVDGKLASIGAPWEAVAGEDYIVQDESGKFSVVSMKKFKEKYDEDIPLRMRSKFLDSVLPKDEKINEELLFETAKTTLGLSVDEATAILRVLLREGSVYEPEEKCYRRVC